MVKIFERFLPVQRIGVSKHYRTRCLRTPLQREWRLTTLQRRCLPVGSGISFREAQEKSPAFTIIQQAVNETIHSINDVDQELLHLFVTKSRDLRPGDLAIRDWSP